DTNLHIRRTAVVPMQHGICDYLVKCLLRILNSLETTRSELFYFFDDLRYLGDGSINNVVQWAFDAHRIGHQVITFALLGFSLVSKNLDGRPLRERGLRFLGK